MHDLSESEWATIAVAVATIIRVVVAYLDRRDARRRGASDADGPPTRPSSPPSPPQ